MIVPIRFIKPVLILAFLIACSLLTFSCKESKPGPYYDVVVLGEGTGAVTAAIQSARSGAKTLYINPLPWAGGMLTSAGVPATDGNHQLNSGQWDEWRAKIRSHYGGVDSVFTGWVSNTMFEPSVGASYFFEMIEAEERLEVMTETQWTDIERNGDSWVIHIPDRQTPIVAKVIVDGTDLGDVAAQLGVSYDIGMDSSADTGEAIAPIEANDIIQDLTYSAILESFPGRDMTISQPDGYDSENYHCACEKFCELPDRHDCQKMLDYGKLPNGKYMINWPFYGNDYYANTIELSQPERQEIYAQAKQHTLGFIYYIQHELGFNHLGLSTEFPSDDGLPLMPYHREGRRIHGIVRMTLGDVTHPYRSNVYRTAVAVGDYPIDHHHYKNDDAPEIDFPAVPSFSIPLGALLPREVPNLIVADKAISVSNIVNGSTRLQPVIMQIGQVAGALAAIAAQTQQDVEQVPVRELQSALLEADCYLLPYIDVKPKDEYFSAVQRIASTGILRGKGKPYKWANQTWFYPDSLVTTDSLISHVALFDSTLPMVNTTDQYLRVSHAKELIESWRQHIGLEETDIDISWSGDKELSRAEFAILIDQYVDPFHHWQIDHNGNVLNQKMNN